ncbi:MAG: AarF/ABC1/UbiB kinase family protein, partial [Nitrospirae bacterium]|nr:AarF/ABC1/UbiB kinase family protein [Nitrospirota bacterium]
HDGREVVVKVQRPNISRTIETDLSILLNLAKLLVRYLSESRLYDPVGLVEEFRKVIHRELDYRVEGRNAEKFRNYFADAKTLHVPEVIWPLSGQRVLTLEYSTGKKVSEVYGDPPYRHGLARTFNDSYLKQIFEYGFFHADPHPGNIFILEDGRICFHDFGIMGRLDEEMMESLANLFLAFLEKDVGTMVDVYLSVGSLTGELDQKGFKRDLKEFIEGYYDLPLRDFSFAEVMNNLIAIGRRYRIAVPTDLLLLGKAFMTVESIVRTLDPDFNLIENIRPYAQVLIRKRLFRPRRLYRDGLKALMGMEQLFKNLPRALNRGLQRLQEGRLEVEVRHEKLEDLERHIDKASGFFHRHADRIGPPGSRFSRGGDRRLPAGGLSRPLSDLGHSPVRKVVVDFHETQPLCRGRGPRLPSVFFGKDFLNLFRRDFPLSHFHEGPHDVPDHVMKEGFGLEGQSDPIPASGNVQSLECPDGVFCPAFRRPEGREIVRPQKEPGSFPHRLQVEGIGMGDVPRGVFQKGRWERPVQDLVFIDLGEGAVAGVKIVRCGFGVEDDDVLGKKAVQGPDPRRFREDPPGLEVGRLAQGMDPRVGSSGPDDLGGLSGKPADGLFQDSLNRGETRLLLPAVITGAVVFEEEFEGSYVIQGVSPREANFIVEIYFSTPANRASAICWR